MTAPKGSITNPLTIADLPFTVPQTGRYWIMQGGQLMQLPESPKGSVLAAQPKPL